jgi:hypothetical protein
VLAVPLTTPQCTAPAARAAILAAPMLAPLRGTVKPGGGGGPDRVICHDLTGDGVPEMTVTVFSGGTAGDIAWIVFKRDGNRWRAAHRELNVYKLRLDRVGSDLVETTPVYRRRDPNCCPSGGFEHRRLHWNGKRFAVTRRWHNGRAGP